MNAVPANKLRHPEDLTVPSKEKVEAVLQNLTDEGAKAFVGELLAALEDARALGDLAPINNVVEAWFRTLLLRTDPAHDQRWAAAQTQVAERPEGHDLETAHRLLGLDQE